MTCRAITSILRATITISLVLVAVASGSGIPYADGGGYTYVTRRTQQMLHAARQRHVTLKLGDGRIGVFGGFGRVDLELFDPDTETFVVPDVTRWFADFSGITLPDGCALLVDGEHDSIFDFATECFVDLENTHVAGFTRWPALVALPDGRIFICGGCDVDYEPLGVCGYFDPKSLRFGPLGKMQIPRYYHGVVLLDDRRVLICGGRGYDGLTPKSHALDTLEVFDTVTGQSEFLPTRLRTPRHWAGCVRLADGQILVIGGSCTQKGEWFLASTEILDIEAGTVSAGPDMALGRRCPHAVTLPSGRVAVFGGRADVRAVEVYEPEKKTFLVAGSLTCDARSLGFTTTPLDTGDVLIVGGDVDSRPEGSQTAEIFTEMAVSVDVSQASDLDVSASAIYARTESWCVEIWDGLILVDTVWLTGYDCPDYRPNDPSPHLAAILEATAGRKFNRLVVRFGAGTDHATRVRLFNLVGWTYIPDIVLGDDLLGTSAGI